MGQNPILGNDTWPPGPVLQLAAWLAGWLAWWLSGWLAGLAGWLAWLAGLGWLAGLARLAGLALDPTDGLDGR